MTHCGMRVLVFTLLSCTLAFGQIDDAKKAIETGEFVRAVNLLAEEIATRPVPDAFLFLGIAYGNMKEYPKAEDTLKEGARRFPNDPRFHNELAGVYLATREVDKAKTELRRALEVDPRNSYASDLIAAIEMSEGEVQSALQFWNRSGRPVIDGILHNYYLNFGSRVVRNAIAFRPGVLHYSAWKTTQSRLLATNVFSNVGLEVEPTTIPDHYNAIVRTSERTNDRMGFLWNLVKGAPYETSYLDVWNIGNSGLNFNSMFRWHPDRRRVETRLDIPLPAPGIVHLELSNTWRNERWDLTKSIRRPFLDRGRRLNYRSNALRAALKHIPHYRVEIGGAFEYTNRKATGDLPELATDSRNTGKLFLETSIRFADSTYQNRLHVEGFAARKSIAGDFNFSGGTVELNNRLTISKDTRTYFDWTIKGGASRGQRPLEDYFVLGLDIHTPNPLRGHLMAERNRYGSAPAGTDFVLANFDIDRRIVTIPMFNNFNLPYIVLKVEGFLDAGKTWDRTHIFENTRLLIDTGAGLVFDTPASAFKVVYGRDLRGGKGVLYGYVERRLW